MKKGTDLFSPETGAARRLFCLANSILPVAPEWQTIECTLDRASWRTGVNELELRFAYAQRPLDVGAGGDVRPLAAAIDWVRVAVP